MNRKDCAVSPEGDSIRLNLPDINGRKCEVVLTFDEASSLAITMPRLLKMALRRKYSDYTLRHVYPLREYAVECASDFRHLLVTLAAESGFDVVFAIEFRTATAIARELASNGKLLAQSQAMLPH
jgi:hypothetical protein